MDRRLLAVGIAALVGMALLFALASLTGASVPAAAASDAIPRREVGAALLGLLLLGALAIGFDWQDWL